MAKRIAIVEDEAAIRENYAAAFSREGYVVDGYEARRPAFQKEGFTIRGIKMMALSDALLGEHYAHIAEMPFFPEVRGFMQETPVIALALSGDNVIARVRDLLGPTDSTQADPGTIRGDFGYKDGDSKMRNVCHASDGPEAAEAELKRFFEDGELFDL